MENILLTNDSISSLANFVELLEFSDIPATPILEMGNVDVIKRLFKREFYIRYQSLEHRMVFGRILM